MKKTKLLFSKKGMMGAKDGMDLAIFAIFMLAIGLSVTVGIYDNLTTPGANATANPASLSGVSGLILGYSPLIIVAVFIYMVAKWGDVV